MRQDKLILAAALLASSAAIAQTEPCTMPNQQQGKGTTASSNGIQDIGNGYNYELWSERNIGYLTYYGGSSDCAFKAHWGNSGDYLARVGYYDGAATKKYTELGDIYAEYKYTKTGNAGGYSYIGVYGWTKSPMIEYYIVNDSYNSIDKPFNTDEIGSYKIDGATYKLYKGTRKNAPNITGKDQDFPQIFAVRQGGWVNCGHISVSEHFKNWEKNGLTLGGIYDCKIVVEAGGGEGDIDFTYATMGWKGRTPSTAKPAEPTETEEPYDGAIAIPGTLECENYDKGGNGFGYYDTDEKNQGGLYRNDEVDIVKANSNYAVGYTEKGEWLKYTVSVAEDGTYNVGAYMANGSSDPTISLTVDGKSAAELTGKGVTGDWDTYAMAKGTIDLTKGEHVLKINFVNSYTNIDYLVFSKDPIADVDNGDNGDSGDTPGVDPQPGTPVSGDGQYFDAKGAYFGPSCDDGQASELQGSYYTGIYHNMFVEYLGKTKTETDAKIQTLWEHYFEGKNAPGTFGDCTVYFENGDEAYILDTGNDDVRSEGMSYGMMICVQLDKQAQFDKIWTWAKRYMLHTNGWNKGYFSWSLSTKGTPKDQGNAPDGEMYFATALLLASHRWGNNGIHNYENDAQYLLENYVKGNCGSLFNESEHVVVFQPAESEYSDNYKFSDPSYDLPAFLELFVRWSKTNTDFWEKCLTATRNHLIKSSNSTSGLFTDYNNFNGTPKKVDFNPDAHNYMYDAMRCAANVGMDYYWFGADATRQTEIMTRLINHFENDKYTHARFSWDGTPLNVDYNNYTVGECGANAVGAMALMGDASNKQKIVTNLNKAWNAPLQTGTYRYYDGLVHFLSMLNLTGNYKIWKEAPTVKDENAIGEYNGETFTADTVIYDYKDCELVKVNISAAPTTNVEESESNLITIAPNPASSKIQIVAGEEIKMVEIMDATGRKVIAENSDVIDVTSLSAGIYVAKITTESNVVVKRVMIQK